MASRRGTRSDAKTVEKEWEEEEEGSNMKDETTKWRKVAEMIGDTLEAVCSMDKEERNALVNLLPPTDQTSKENVNQFVDVDQLLSDDDEEDLYRKNWKPKEKIKAEDGVSATPSTSQSNAIPNTNTSSRPDLPNKGSSTDSSIGSTPKSPSAHDMKPNMNNSLCEMSNTTLYLSFNGDEVPRIQDLNEILVNKQSKKMPVTVNIQENINVGGKVPEVDIENSIENMDVDAKSNTKDEFQTPLVEESWTSAISSFSETPFVTPTAENKRSDERKFYDDQTTKTGDLCSEAIENTLLDNLVEKNISWDESLKFEDKFFLRESIKQVPSTKECFSMIEDTPHKYKFVQKVSNNAALQDILKFFSGIKHIKSQAVGCLDAEPILESVQVDSSVKNGFAVLVPGKKRKIKDETDVTDTMMREEHSWWERASREQSKVDSLGRTRASTSVYDSVFNVDPYDYEEDSSVDSEHDEWEITGAVAKKKMKLSKSKGKGKTIAGKGKGSKGIKGKGKGGGKTATKEDQKNVDLSTQSSIRDFLVTESSSPVSPIHDYNTRRQQSNVDEFEEFSQMGAGVSRNKSEETDQSSPQERTPPRMRKEETGVCPSCQRVFWVSQVEKHLTECKKDFCEGDENYEEKELCVTCLQMIPLSSIEAHSEGCVEEPSLLQRIQSKKNLK